jgi:hypothetical protein
LKIKYEGENNSVQEIQEIFLSINFDKWIHENILYGIRPSGDHEPNNAT